MFICLLYILVYVLLQAGNVKSSRREGEHSLLWPVDELSDNERDRLVESLRQAHEIALSLVYTNGSSQLREQTENKVSLLCLVYLYTMCAESSKLGPTS